MKLSKNNETTEERMEEVAAPVSKMLTALFAISLVGFAYLLFWQFILTL